ncbi:MAG: D-lactate dehydrogenase [Candidatus Sedimenticola sp. 1PA]
MLTPDTHSDFPDAVAQIVGDGQLLTSNSRTRYYRTGIRIGGGACCAVVLPTTLLQLWQVLQVCIKHDKIIIIQAANTGLNGGSTPFGDDYDREIVIINTLKINQIFLLNQGRQALALAGSTLYQLEDALRPLQRSPHSVIGSSCIGASVIGGVCNSSGGNLVNRGPAYTELSLYAQLTEGGELQLINHLGIDLGDSPEEILTRLQQGNFDHGPGLDTAMASDREYQQRVRDIDADTPARFNADQRRLHESSGCAGKLAVFAVRLDTFAEPTREQVLYIGTNNPDELTRIRKHILTRFETLPEMAEYMHRSYFDGADHYCKDTFLAIKYFGTAFLPKLFAFKARADNVLDKLPFLPNKLVDRSLQFIADKLMPDHLPKRIRDYRDRFEHYLIIKAIDDSIETTRQLLNEIFADSREGEFFACNRKEGEAILLHRFVAGGASTRFALLHGDKIDGLMPLDIALPRNDDNWHNLYPKEITDKLAADFRLAHFFCMVFHHDFVVKNGVDMEKLKEEMLAILDERGAKYPAEHNVGHLYQAESQLAEFYRECDPTNSFNPGIGKTSKCRHYQ